MRDTQSELHEMPTGYASSSSSDDTEDQMLGIRDNEGTLKRGPSGIPLVAEVRLDISSRDTLVPLKQEAETHVSRVARGNNEREANGLLRPLLSLDILPPARRQKASGVRDNPRRRPTGNRSVDVAYNSIPDYAPPTSTLSNGDPHILQVQWREKPYVDLSNDPDRHMLHEAELELATSLNLSCAKYLCSKRRIFQACFKALQVGREFKKTAGQKACKINTNKASKICGAFEKVGWFDKKYFLQYLDESNSPVRKANIETEERRSCSSALTEPDIWNVSDSEFHATSEGEEETTDDDTADSSVSFDGRYDEIEGRRILDSYRGNSLRRQHYGPSLIAGDGSQPGVLRDPIFQTHDTLSGNEAIDNSPVTEDGRPKRGVALEETVHSRISDSLPGDDTDDDTGDIPLLETRSMTRKTKPALANRSGNKSDRFSSNQAESSQQRSIFERFNRRGDRLIPRSLDDASAADLILIKMKEQGRSWPEIEEAWVKTTGKAKSAGTLSTRYTRIKANLPSALLQPHDVRNDGAITNPSGRSLEHDQLLLAAEAEIEGNFQREKAELIAEIENNFQSEKWNLVAEAMSRTESTRCSAESIKAQYERLAANSKRADTKKEENVDTFGNLPQRVTRMVRGRQTVTLTPSRSGLERQENLDPFVNMVKRGRQAVRKTKSQTFTQQSERARRAWAIRRALGTNGRDGGPPKTKKAKIAVPNAAPNAEIPLASTVTYKSGLFQKPLPGQTTPMVIEQEVRRDANPHKQSLAHIVPPAPQTDTAAKRIEPDREVGMYQKPHGVLVDQAKHGTKRHTCRKCGMGYVNRANHYRVLHNIGSEHTRRMAANNAAAAVHLGSAITETGVEKTSDVPMGQMIFNISAREQSPELLMSREDRTF